MFLLNLEQEALRGSVRRADTVIDGVLNLDGPVQRIAAILSDRSDVGGYTSQLNIRVHLARPGGSGPLSRRPSPPS